VLLGCRNTHGTSLPLLSLDGESAAKRNAQHRHLEAASWLVAEKCVPCRDGLFQPWARLPHLLADLRLRHGRLIAILLLQSLGVRLSNACEQ